jgi:diacylglycerol kinase (ATP)
MRAAFILGPGCSESALDGFRVPGLTWQTGMPASREEADVILLCGGDGTLHRHLPRLVDLQLPVLMVPKGSGNDFARALGLHRLSAAVAAWRAFVGDMDVIRPVDVGEITELDVQPVNGLRSPRAHYFATVAGVGLDGEVARRANGLPRWLRGSGGYVLSLLPSLLRFTPLPMRITSPEACSLDEGFKPTTLAAFANVAAYGGGMKIAPQAQPDDGMLDVCVVGDIARFKLFCLFPSVYFGGHIRRDKVEYSRISRVRVETEFPLDVYADGEFVCQTPVEIALKPGALRVIAPMQRS